MFAFVTFPKMVHRLPHCWPLIPVQPQPVAGGGGEVVAEVEEGVEEVERLHVVAT